MGWKNFTVVRRDTWLPSGVTWLLSPQWPLWMLSLAILTDIIRKHLDSMWAHLYNWAMDRKYICIIILDRVKYIISSIKKKKRSLRRIIPLAGLEFGGVLSTGAEKISLQGPRGLLQGGKEVGGGNQRESSWELQRVAFPGALPPVHGQSDGNTRRTWLTHLFCLLLSRFF